MRKNDHFELEICVKERGGRAARCMGSVPVADLLASEPRRDRPSGNVSRRQWRVRRPYLLPFRGRSIERVVRDLATPSNELHLLYGTFCLPLSCKYLFDSLNSKIGAVCSQHLKLSKARQLSARERNRERERERQIERKKEK